MKRLLHDNVNCRGKLNTDAVMLGILQIRNTPEGDSDLSPARILFGQIQDTLPLCPPIPSKTTIFDNDSGVISVWEDVWQNKLKSWDMGHMNSNPSGW